MSKVQRPPWPGDGASKEAIDEYNMQFAAGVNFVSMTDAVASLMNAAEHAQANGEDPQFVRGILISAKALAQARDQVAEVFELGRAIGTENAVDLFLSMHGIDPNNLPERD